MTINEIARPSYDNSATATPGKAVFLVCTCDRKFGDNPECAFHGRDPHCCHACWRPLTDEPQDDLEPTRWWRVIDSEGKLWCETSDEAEARRAVRPGDTLQRRYQDFNPRMEWRDES